MTRKFLNSPERWVALPIFIASLSLTLLGCPGEVPEDGGTPEPGVDAGEPEAPIDGGVDAGPGPIDAGVDAGPGPIDAGVDAGPPPPVDAGVYAGPPPPVVDVVRVEGQVKRADYVEAYYQANAVVSFKNLATPLTANPSAPDTGAWYIDGVPAASNVLTTALYDGVGSPAARTTQQKKYIPADGATYTYNPYVVTPAWLEQVATECGAPIAPGVDGFPSVDFVNTSTIMGTFKDANGAPVAGITKANVAVEMQGGAGAYTNSDPQYICFLQSDGGTPAKYKGGNYLTSDASGKFVIFKVRNAAAGNGAGNAYVRATYNGVSFEESIPLASGLAYVDVYAQDVIPVIDQLIDFETQILPILTANQCNACHTTGGTGAVDRGGYLAVFDGTPSEVYNNLVAPGTVCEQGGATYRICGNYPLQSYLITKPLIDPPGQQNHPNETWLSDTDPDVIMISNWIEQGYPRYAVPPEPPPVNATFADVMNLMRSSLEGGINCVNCHGYNTGYSGNLAVDGCIDNAAIQAEYTAAGVDYNSATNPDYYKEDCAYYHVALQQSNHYVGGGDAYYVSAANNYSRINTEYPNRSLLYRKPYCNPGRCVVNPLVHSGNPNLATFFDEVSQPAATIIDWVTAGGGYSRANGPNPAP